MVSSASVAAASSTIPDATAAAPEVSSAVPSPAAEEAILIEEFKTIVDSAEASGDISAAEATQLRAELVAGDSEEFQTMALPAIGLPVVLACVGTVGLSAYQAYKGGDPVEYIASAIIGCIPFGAAARPAVVSLIKSNKGAIATGLKAVGASSLALSLEGSSAR